MLLFYFEILIVICDVFDFCSKDTLICWPGNARYPSAVFVGDTYTYFAGMAMAVVGILGHFRLVFHICRMLPSRSMAYFKVMMQTDLFIIQKHHSSFW